MTRVRFILCGLALHLYSTLLAQDRLLPVFPFRQLSTADGLPANEIRTRAVRDHHGFIWVGTNNGLARYDGYSCKVYRNRQDDPHSISSNRLKALYVDRRGLLWIGTWDAGISLYDAENDQFVNFLPREKDSTWLGQRAISGFHEDPAGNIWCGSFQSEIVLIDLSAVLNQTSVDSITDHLQFHTYALGKPKDFVCLDDWDERALLCGTSHGLFTIDRKSRRISRPDLPVVSGINLDTVKITALLWETPQRLWIATHLYGLYLFDRTKGSIASYHKRPVRGKELRDNQITDIRFDALGRFWVGTSTTLDLFDPSTGSYQEYLTSTTDLPQRISSISLGDKSVLWIGTQDLGLHYLTSLASRTPHYALRGSDEKPRWMESIDRWDDDSYFISTEGKVVQVKLANLRVIRMADLFKGDRPTYGGPGVKNSYRDDKGRIWYGTWGLGLYRFEPENGRVMNFRPSTQLSGLLYKSDVCRRIIGGRRDSLWIAGYRDGLLQFDTHTNTFSKPSGIVNQLGLYVWSVTEDSGGKLWISVEQEGLFVFDPKTSNYQHFKHDAKLSTSLSHDHVRTVFQDLEGRIWVGCKDLNLWSPETKSFAHFPNSAFPEAYWAIPMGTDARGRLWVNFDGGLGILNPATGLWRSFGATAGLCGGVFTMYRLEDGRVLLTGSGGMNIVHPDSLFKVEPAPPLVLTRISINDSMDVPPQSLSDEAPLQLRYDQNVLELEFAAIDPGNAHMIKYQYRLEGLEDHWINANGRRFVRYSGLGPDDYRFRAKAINVRGYWPEEEIVVSLSIAPPWWQRWWFRLMAGGAVIGLLGFVYRREVTRLRKDKLIQQEFSRRQIESQEAERKRLAAELHDGLGQDLLVANNELQQFMQENTESREELKQVASLVQESIQSVREISSNLHPHHLDRLGFCAAVEAMTENISRSTGLTIQRSCDDIDRLLPKETEIHVYRIIQEALSNVVRHASAKNVTVQVKKNSESIEITVTDDGKGFSVNETLERRPSRPSGEGLHGFGLSSMTERVRIIGGTMKIESTPGLGTKVRVSLPIPEGRH